MTAGGHGEARRPASGPGLGHSSSVADGTEMVREAHESFGGTTKPGCVREGLGEQRVWVLFSGTERLLQFEL